ncbi:Acyl-phosphate:glycerol-3-phosphate O-acyltransferase PlsY (EC 2.3.1.n3) [hydrothermal vent metagenome]|uniref:Acyl-phosphate:glycerol-3-phosphate O-acyltransferase PlsY n=1 Tax=hydrothermal vent metagenome TaxID=652676 RepID=A0A3B0R7T5_9ZZZZ
MLTVSDMAISDMDFTILAFLALGYFFGSVPFGLLLTKAAGKGDIRAIGSNSIGATNVLRTGSKKLAFATLLADVLKGAVPVLIALYMADQIHAMAAGFGAFIGHIFPVWLKFKGGKGVATYLGVLFGIFWPTALVFAVTWLTTAYLKKISSLAALVACVCVAIAGYFLSGLAMFVFLGVLAAIIFWAHRENISRLMAGTESKISFSKSK